MIPSDPLHPNPQPPRMQWWKPSLWVPVLIGVGVLQALIVLAGLGYYIYVDLPESTYAHIYDSPWRECNVSNLAFKSPVDFAKARATLLNQSHHAENRNNPVPAYLLAELDNTLAHSTEAIRMYQQVIRMAEQSWYTRFAYRNFLSNAHAALAVLYYEHGNMAESKTELDAIPDFSETDQPNLLQALRDRIENPERADFHLLLGKELRHQLKVNLASHEIQAAEQLSDSPQLRLDAVNFMKTQMPRRLSDLSPMARYYSLAGEGTDDPGEAAAYYEQAVQQTPDYEWGYNELAILYRTLKDYDQAVDRANRAIAINPNFYNPYLTLGDIAIDRNQYPAAIHYFETAQKIIQRLPSEDSQTLNANIENQLGYANELMNHIDEAAQHYQLAMLASANDDQGSDEDYDYAQEGLERMNTARQNAASAAHAAPAQANPQISWKQ